MNDPLPTARIQKTRRVYEWTPPSAPPLGDLLGSPQQRGAWIRYWITDNISNGFELFFYVLFKFLPVDLVSMLGGRLVSIIVPLTRKWVLERAAANFRKIHPEWSEARVAEGVRRHVDNIGRVMAEVAKLEAIARSGRVEIVNPHILEEMKGGGPCVYISMHTGNWELTGAVLSMHGIGFADIYTPPSSRMQHWIANRVRARLGIVCLPPGRAGTLPAIRELQRGGRVAIFCDEVHYDHIMAPFLGREPHVDGNLAIAIRMARLTGARIYIGQCVRLEGCRFRITYVRFPDLQPESRRNERLFEDVLALNATLEGMICDHVDQWYFADNEF